MVPPQERTDCENKCHHTKVGPRVRIRFAPAASQQRTTIGASSAVLALPALHAQLSRRGGSPRGARARRILRNRPELGAEVRTGDRATTATASSSAERPLASGRCVTNTFLKEEMWSCTRDEGGPLDAGGQAQASNHCKLLSSRAMVVSIAAKGGTRSRQV